jgi:predicted AAA+ superfamily ATPase
MEELKASVTVKIPVLVAAMKAWFDEKIEAIAGPVQPRQNETYQIAETVQTNATSSDLVFLIDARLVAKPDFQRRETDALHQRNLAKARRETCLESSIALSAWA